jgi:hypothetical protein
MHRVLFFVAVACLAASRSSACLAQDYATGGSNNLSREEWQSLVNTARERLEHRREELRLEREKRLRPMQEELRLNRRDRIEPRRDELRRERENNSGPPLPPVGSTIDPARFGMPTSDTAGVQAGVTLAAYEGPMTVTTPGVLIENVIINGTLTVAADNVTIKNCIIRNFAFWGIRSDNAVNTRVEYCDIDGTGSTRTSGLGIGGGTNSAIIGCDISGMVIGIQLSGRAEVRDNYIHNLADTSSNPDDRHFDGITLFGGQDGSVIEHNTISMPTGSGGTAAVFIKTEFGPIDGVLVKDNLMYGDPSYAVYVESTTRRITNVTVENNYVERGYYGYFNVVNSTPIIRNNIQWDNQKNPIPYPKK